MVVLDSRAFIYLEKYFQQTVCRITLKEYTVKACEVRSRELPCLILSKLNCLNSYAATWPVN